MLGSFPAFRAQALSNRRPESLRDDCIQRFGDRD
jgi:hypothetical protein